jgi:hypothetical protein
VLGRFGFTGVPFRHRKNPAVAACQPDPVQMVFAKES